MSYVYTVGLKVIVEEVLTALTETPTVYAYDFLTGDALTSPAPTITSVRTGVYRLSVTANVLTDVLFVFIPHQDDEDKIGQEALMHEKMYHVVDELADGVTLVDSAITATKIASNAINDTKIAADAIDVTKISDGTITAAKIAIDAVSKIQSGLATSNALSTTDGKVDAVKTKTDNLPPSPAAVGSAMILTSAYDKAKDDVLTPLGVIDGKADAIKLQTDKIPNTPAVTGEYTSALTAIQADLDNPGQYKADISGLAKTTDLSGLAEKTDIPSDYAKASTLSTVNGKADAIKAQTDKIPATPAPANEYDTRLLAIQSDLDNPDQYKANVVGLMTSAEYTVPDNAGITDIKAKTDQLTFTTPNMVDASVDVGGLAEDIAEALEPIMPTPENIWTHAKRTLTMTPAEILSYIQQTAITQTRGNSWNIGIEDVSLPAAKQQIAIKQNHAQKDSQALLFIDTAGDLLVVNGKALDDHSGASLTYAGDTLTLKLDAEITARFKPGTYIYGIQGIASNGSAVEPYGGVFTIVPDVVRRAK